MDRRSKKQKLKRGKDRLSIISRGTSVFSPGPGEEEDEQEPQHLFTKVVSSLGIGIGPLFVFRLFLILDFPFSSQRDTSFGRAVELP